MSWKAISLGVFGSFLFFAGSYMAAESAGVPAADEVVFLAVCTVITDSGPNGMSCGCGAQCSRSDGVSKNCTGKQASGTPPNCTCDCSSLFSGG